MRTTNHQVVTAIIIKSCTPYYEIIGSVGVNLLSGILMRVQVSRNAEMDGSMFHIKIKHFLRYLHK